MKKYLLPLILILFLTFTLIGDCWVAGYDQRIKLTIDNTKIDAGLSDFPVTAFFTVTQAEEIFAEFDADEDFDRGQFALGDDTLLKAEKELFDDSEILAIYHIKIPTISSSADTDYYFYYDNDAGHNTSYIGIIGSATGAEVWVDYVVVWHMVDDTTSTVLDSTSNNNDGTKVSANNPIEAAGKVGQGQDFDGDSDYIDITGITTGTSFTVEFISEYNTAPTLSRNPYWLDSASGRFVLGKQELSTKMEYYDGTAWRIGDYDIPNDSNLHYIAYVLDGVTPEGKIIIDTNITSGMTYSANSIGGTTIIGAHNAGAVNHIEGILDEFRISNTNRSTAWTKGTKNTLWDTLLTYGSEEIEVEEVTVNAIFFGMPF